MKRRRRLFRSRAELHYDALLCAHAAESLLALLSAQAVYPGDDMRRAFDHVREAACQLADAAAALSKDGVR